MHRTGAHTVRMAEVLSSGYPEGPDDGGRPRWLAGVLVLVVAVGLGVLAVRAGGGGDRPAPDAAPVVETRAPVVVPPVALPPEPVYQLDGVPGPGPAGARLVVGGARPGVVDAATGRLTPLPALGLRAGENAWVRRGPGFTVVLSGWGSRPAPAAVLVPDAGARVPLGTAVDALPMRDGTVLTVACPPGSEASCTVSRRTRTGGTLWTRADADFLGLLADTPAGVVAAAVDGDALRLALVEPRTGRVLRAFGRAAVVLAVSDRRVAWTPEGCTSACPVLVADLAGGGTRRLPAAAGRAATGAFSADSERLAVGFAGLHAEDPDRARARDGYAAVIDLGRGGWVRAPGLTTGPKSSPVPRWVGDRLLLAVADGKGAGRIASWSPGEPRLTLLPVRLTGFDAVPDEFTAA